MTFLLKQSTICVLLAVTGLFCRHASAWSTLPGVGHRHHLVTTGTSGNTRGGSRGPFRYSFALPYANSNEDNTPTSLERVSVQGVTISPDGFQVLLQTKSGHFPVLVTNDPQDAVASTSPEALTLIQLLSGVDMAGAILPPNVLARLVVQHAEATPLSCPKVLDCIKTSLHDLDVESYTTASPWMQNKISLPTVTLDQLNLIVTPDGGIQFRLECVVKEIQQTLTFSPSPESIEQVCYHYEQATSEAFVCLALALRYKAPIVLQQQGDSTSSLFLDQKKLQQAFPQLKTVTNLQQQSTRVTKNIAQGFEYHKWTGALNIALEKGDMKAVVGIQAKLDEMDSLKDLPTLSVETQQIVIDAQDDTDNIMQ